MGNNKALAQVNKEGIWVGPRGSGSLDQFCPRVPRSGGSPGGTEDRKTTQLPVINWIPKDQLKLIIHLGTNGKGNTQLQLESQLRNI